MSLNIWAAGRQNSTRARELGSGKNLSALQSGIEGEPDDAGALVRTKTKNGRPPPDTKISGANLAAWEAFKRIDEDCSGLLDDSETQELVRQLGFKNLELRRVRRDLSRVKRKDPAGLSFREFAQWWNRHREIERRRARRDVKELFDAVDHDNSGSLEKEELGSLVRKAGAMIVIETEFDLESDWDLMRHGAPADVEGVSFPMFETWWKARTGHMDMDMLILPEFISERLTDRIGGVNSFFMHSLDSGAEMAVDESWAPSTIWIGGLTQTEATESTVIAEFAQFGPAKACHVRVKDGSGKCWALLSFEEEGDANAAVQTGNHPRGWTVAKIKPEMLTSLHAQIVMDSQQVDSTNRGRALWKFLGSRLRRLLDVQKVWGEVQTMYESRDASIYDDMPMPPFILVPDSGYRAAWDTFMVLLICYLCGVLPLRLCFDDGPELGSLLFWIDVVTDFGFVLDVVINFRTAFFDRQGVLEERPRAIANHYLRGWFLWDLISCLPLQMLSQVFGPGDMGSGKAFKAIRLIRLSKMLRLTWLERTLGRHFDARYGVVTKIFSMLILALSIIFAAHLLACGW